jgi:hypothetical protein
MAEAGNVRDKNIKIWGILCLVLGIFSLITSIFLIGIFLGVAGIVLAIVQLRKPVAGRSWLWWGLGVSVAGTLLGIGVAGFYMYLISNFSDSLLMLPKPLKDISGDPIDNLAVLNPQYQMVQTWEKASTDTQYITTGDWDEDGQAEILLLSNKGIVSVLSDKNEPKGSIKVDPQFSTIELGQAGPGKVLLSAHALWGDKLKVYDTAGTLCWSYPVPQGVSGAHWGDINGDGKEEIILGMSMLGGLCALDGDGKLVWKNSRILNILNHAVLSATSTQPSLVAASDLTGCLSVFDGKTGKLQYKMNTPLGYTYPMNVVDVDGQGNWQILTQAVNLSRKATNNILVSNGQILWKYDVREEEAGWMNLQFSHGDWDGDGIQDWAFKLHPYRLIVVSGKGNVLGDLKLQDEKAIFALMTRKGEKGLLLVQEGNTLKAYEPVAPEVPADTIDKSSTSRE